MKYLEIYFNKISARMACWKLQKLLLTITEDLNKWRRSIIQCSWIEILNIFSEWKSFSITGQRTNVLWFASCHKYFMFASLWHYLFLSLKHESSDRKYMCVWVLSWSVVSNSCDPTDCSLLGFSVHGILQARILEWVAISFSRWSAWPRNRTQVFCTGGILFTHWTTEEAKYINQHSHVSITFIYKSRFWAGFDLWFSLLTSDLKVSLIKEKKKYMDVSESDSVMFASLEFSRPEQSG